MPWKERSIVEERMRFVLRLKDGESMASLCREFGISRVTGYKIYERYKECGLEGLTDRARTPYRYANKLPAQLEAMIVSMRREKPTWGARKLSIDDSPVRTRPCNRCTTTHWAAGPTIKRFPERDDASARGAPPVHDDPEPHERCFWPA